MIQLIKIELFITLQMQNKEIYRILILRSQNKKLNINLKFWLFWLQLAIFLQETKSETYFDKHLSRWILRYLAETKDWQTGQGCLSCCWVRSTLSARQSFILLVSSRDGLREFPPFFRDMAEPRGFASGEPKLVLGLNDVFCIMVNVSLSDILSSELN